MEAVGVAGGWRDRGAGVTAGVTAGRSSGGLTMSTDSQATDSSATTSSDETSSAESSDSSSSSSESDVARAADGAPTRPETWPEHVKNHGPDHHCARCVCGRESGRGTRRYWSTKIRLEARARGWKKCAARTQHGRCAARCAIGLAKTEPNWVAGRPGHSQKRP